MPPKVQLDRHTLPQPGSEESPLWNMWGNLSLYQRRT